MTLLELTVVILILLSLVSALFIGTQAWKRASDRSGCILNIRKVQVATRAYQNVHNIPAGSFIDLPLTVLGPQGLASIPSCPGNGSYSPLEHIPHPGELAINCSLADLDEHAPSNHADW